MKPVGGVVTLTGHPQDLRTAIGDTLADDFSYARSFVLKAGSGNTGTVFIGGGTVSSTTAYTFLAKGESIGFDISSGDHVNLANLSAISSATTANDTLFVLAIE